MNISQKKAALAFELELLRELERRGVEPHVSFKPYDKQSEFYELGKVYPERAFFAANQVGKTVGLAHETFYHLTGLYPDDWKGMVFEEPTTMWVCGDTGETIRDTTQRILFDRPGKMDTPDEYIGVIPLRLVVDEPISARGVPGLYDHVKIRHETGGTSYCYFKAYSKGRQKFQGETIDGVWLDEEPPADIYSEALTRTNNGQNGQFSYLTFTPLLGMSEVVHKFLLDPSPQQASVTMTIEDVDHYTDEEKGRIIESYPEHEREARARGIPIMGSGLIFPVAESTISERHIMEIPSWWRRINCIDFGWDHPTACVQLLHDPENDIIHVRSVHKQRKATPIEIRHSVLSWPDWVPWAWPHDGLQHDKGSGEQLAKQYKRAGFNMLSERSTFAGGSNGVEAGISEMLERMNTGRFKVDELLLEWFEELRLYHRKDGKIVKLREDILSATRYGVMSLRFAVSEDEANVQASPIPTWRDKLRKHIKSNKPRGSMTA